MHGVHIGWFLHALSYLFVHAVPFLIVQDAVHLLSLSEHLPSCSLPRSGSSLLPWPHGSWFSFYPFTSSGFLWGSVLLLLGYSVFVLFQRFCFLVRNSPPGFGDDSAHVISILLTTAWTSLLSWGLLIYHTFPLNLQQIIPHSPYIHHLS